ncbi:MAG: cell division protein FtsH, partial [Candidatus Pacebacteria bacterium RIFCSPHIGHO2_01_FULL_46_10]
ILILIVMRRQMGGDSGIFAIGKSKAKLFNKGKQNVKFADVGGLTEAKRELEEIVDFLKNPKKYRDVGARVPKGALLVGPSGTGKTMLARAVAGEANVPFLSMAGSEFMEMLVGVGASRARDLFETAKRVAPSIIFIDEIDAIGRMRGFGSMGGHDEREQTLNQILVEMDGFTPNDTVIVLAATNRGDLLDPALVRPGRFDRRVTLDLPDLEERKFILRIHAKNKPFIKDLIWEKIAKRTVGFSGADLENMLNEAAILIAREGRTSITAKDIEEAALKVKLGPEKKRLQSDYERKMTAYHEGGHAILSHYLPNTDPVHRISIVSRGRALGFTMTPPETDKYQQTQSELEDEIVVLLGGRTAEKLIFNELTGGASSDIDRATRIARAMVIDYGMSGLGPVNLGPQYDTSDYGRAVYEPPKLSDDMQAKVDKEISQIITTAMKKAEILLAKYKKELDKVAAKLLEVETLEGEEFEALLDSKKTKPKHTGM